MGNATAGVHLAGCLDERKQVDTKTDHKRDHRRIRRAVNR